MNVKIDDRVHRAAKVAVARAEAQSLGALVEAALRMWLEANGYAAELKD